MHIRDWPEGERPREKLLAQGPGSLSDAELLAIFLGSGTAGRDAVAAARGLLGEHGGLRPLLDREMDGFSAVFHQASSQTVGVSTLQSRALAGQIGDRFIFCVPGSTGACRDAWDLVLGLEFDSRYRPCSIAGQVPRLRGLCA